MASATWDQQWQLYPRPHGSFSSAEVMTALSISLHTQPLRYPAEYQHHSFPHLLLALYLNRENTYFYSGRTIWVAIKILRLLRTQRLITFNIRSFWLPKCLFQTQIPFFFLHNISCYKLIFAHLHSEEEPFKWLQT